MAVEASAGAQTERSQLEWWTNVCHSRDEQQRLAKEAICDHLSAEQKRQLRRPWVGNPQLALGSEREGAVNIDCRAQMQMATGTGKTHARHAVEDQSAAMPHTPTSSQPECGAALRPRSGDIARDK